MAKEQPAQYYDPKYGAKTREDFLKNEDFLLDAQQTLFERTGETYEDPEEIVDEIAELFRYSTVNEYTAIMNLNHVRKSSKEAKERFGKMYLAFENSKGMTSGWETAKDYAGGFLTAPSTALTLGAGIFSAPLTAIAKRSIFKGITGDTMRDLAEQVATGQVQKLSKKEAAKKAALKAGAFEGSVATLQGYSEASAKKETEIEEYEDINVVGQSALFGSVGAITGGAIAAPFAARRLGKAQELSERANIAFNTKAANDKQIADSKKGEWTLFVKQQTKEGKQAEAKEIKKTMAGDEFLKAMSDKKAPLPKEAVAKGEEITEELFPEIKQAYRVGFTKDVHENFISAASEIVMKANLKSDFFFIEKGDKKVRKRISQILTDALDIVASDLSNDTGEILNNRLAAVDDILKKYNLSSADFRNVLVSDISNIARTLQLYGTAEKNIFRKVPTKKNLEDMSRRYQKLQSDGFISEEQRARLEEILKAQKTVIEKATLGDKVIDKTQRATNFVYTGLKKVDKTRLGLMTIQVATTVRNTANATGRLALYALDNAFHGAATLDASRMMAGPRAVAAMINPGEADFLKLVFSQSNVEEFGDLFKQLADIDAESVAGSKLVGVSRFLNTLNTIADNAFKRSIFLAELQSRVGSKELRDFMNTGQFYKVGQEDLQKSMQEALSFTYQRGYAKRGKGMWEGIASNFITAFSQPGLSNAIPFPRFIANSLEFMYQHAPILGLMDIPAKLIRADKGKLADLYKEDIAKRIGKNLTGVGMLFGAIQLRASQGPNAKWWEIYDEDTDTYKNALPFYGPFAPFMLLADVIVRTHYADNLLTKSVATKWQDIDKKGFIEELYKKERFIEFTKAAFGSQFKAGLGLDLIDSYITDMAKLEDDTVLSNLIDQKGEQSEEYQSSYLDKTDRITAKFLGNFFNSGLVGFGVVKDLYATFDPKDYSGIKQTDSVNPLELGIRKALRSLPINNEGEYFGLFSSKDFVGQFKSVGSEPEDVLRTTGFYPLGQEFATDPSAPGQSLTRQKNLLRQLSGLSTEGRKNPVEEELDSRNIEDWRLYPIVRDEPELNNYLKKYYQVVNRDRILPYIQSNVYKNLSTGLKKEALEKKIRKEIPNPLTAVYEILELEARKKGLTKEKRNKLKFLQVKTLQVRYSKLPKFDRKAVVELYKKSNKRNPDLRNSKDLITLIRAAPIVRSSIIGN